MAYLMDSNALIQPKNHFYRFSFCPGFWDWIVAHHGTGELFSVKKVEEEIEQGADQLNTWVANTTPAGFFIVPTPEVVTTQGVVSRWVNAQEGYAPAEKARFLGKADPWLIAEAIENSHEIVTFEDMVPPNSTKVKIPNVAENFGVKCVTLFDVLEGSGVLFRI